jgi:hypothetical protein
MVLERRRKSYIENGREFVKRPNDDDVDKKKKKERKQNSSSSTETDQPDLASSSPYSIINVSSPLHKIKRKREGGETSYY